jgi:hypothetical protein
MAWKRLSGFAIYYLEARRRKAEQTKTNECDCRWLWHLSVGGGLNIEHEIRRVSYTAVV